MPSLGAGFRRVLTCNQKAIQDCGKESIHNIEYLNLYQTTRLPRDSVSCVLKKWTFMDP